MDSKTKEPKYLWVPNPKCKLCYGRGEVDQFQYGDSRGDVFKRVPCRCLRKRLVDANT